MRNDRFSEPHSGLAFESRKRRPALAGKRTAGKLIAGTRIVLGVALAALAVMAAAATVHDLGNAFGYVPYDAAMAATFGLAAFVLLRRQFLLK